jgi:NADH:ubiquinone oxidoreductase subunit
MATIGTKIFTWLRGNCVGSDANGNRYFEEKTSAADSRKKRWVMYQGEVEASKIPAEWHGWMHYTTDVLPSASPAPRYPWQKPHQPNPTGTEKRHLPAGHLARGGLRDASASGDYIPWNPS